MAKPITARTSCTHCRRNIRLTGIVVRELTYSLSANVTCPACRRSFFLNLLTPPSLSAMIPPPAPLEMSPPPVPPQLPAPTPNPPLEPPSLNQASLPFRPLIEENSAERTIEAPFAPLSLAGPESLDRRHQQLPMHRMIRAIPLGHGIAWALAVIVASAALWWPANRLPADDSKPEQNQSVATTGGANHGSR